MLKMLKNFRTELQVHALGSAAAAAEGRVFDEREVEVIKSRAAKGIASQRAESALIGPRAAGNMNGMLKKFRCVVGAFTEVVLAVNARGGKMRHGDLVGAIHSVRSCAGLLDAAEDGERRA